MKVEGVALVVPGDDVDTDVMYPGAYLNVEDPAQMAQYLFEGFDPTVLKGKPGEQVTLELKNEGKREHNFSVDAQGVDKDIEAGADATVTVTIPRSGEISFYCSYHRSKGMAGALEATGGPGGGMTTSTTSTGGGGY